MARLLVLEDDETLVQQIKTYLEMDGHKVLPFSTATAALDFLATNVVDLIIADLFIRVEGEMTQDGGIKLISHVRQVDGKDIPVIAISGSFRESHGEFASSTAITVGATANLAKPFHPLELSKLVDLQLKLYNQSVARKSNTTVAI